MKKTIALTVALAAGLTAFAANAAEFPNISRTPLFSAKKTASTAKSPKTETKSNNLAGQKLAIERTPLFPSQKAASGPQQAKPVTGKARPNAGAVGKPAKARKASKAKMAKLNVRASRAGTAVRKQGATIFEAETATGYAAKPDLKAVATPAGPASYQGVIARYAAQYGVPVSLAHAVISVESNYRPNTTGSAGEVGLMQIKPATARSLGYAGSTKGLYDVETNIRYGMQYLAMAQHLGDGTTCGTILKYNAGHGASRMNPVSRAYCGKVQRLLAG